MMRERLERRTMGRDLTMQLRTRIDGGGTRPLDAWGVDSEYGGGAVHCMCQALRRGRVRAT
jgi:hypothetical protein